MKTGKYKGQTEKDVEKIVESVDALTDEKPGPGRKHFKKMVIQAITDYIKNNFTRRREVWKGKDDD